MEDLLRVAGHPAAAREYASTWRIHEEGKGSVLFTALGLADTYSRPGVAVAVETGNVFRYPRLPHLLTTARGNGIQLLLVYHDLAQVEHLYGGREVARTLVSNAKLRMLLPGVADLETLRYWSDLMGQTRTHTHGTTTGTDGRRSRTSSEHADQLAPLHRLQQLPDGHAVLLYQNLPPARVRLLPWYADRRFRHLAKRAHGMNSSS